MWGLSWCSCGCPLMPSDWLFLKLLMLRPLVTLAWIVYWSCLPFVPRRKAFLEIFAGTGVLTHAMQKSGFDATMHALYVTGHDVLPDNYFTDVTDFCTLRGVSHLHFGTHCVTWSRANCQLKGIYRSLKWLRGVPWLRCKKLLLCEEVRALRLSLK